MNVSSVGIKCHFILHIASIKKKNQRNHSNQCNYYLDGRGGKKSADVWTPETASPQTFIIPVVNGRSILY